MKEIKRPESVAAPSGQKNLNKRHSDTNTIHHRSTITKEVNIKREYYDKLLKIAAYRGVPSRKIIEIAIEVVVGELWNHEDNQPKAWRTSYDKRI